MMHEIKNSMISNLNDTVKITKPEKLSKFNPDRKMLQANNTLKLGIEPHGNAMSRVSEHISEANLSSDIDRSIGKLSVSLTSSDGNSRDLNHVQSGIKGVILTNPSFYSNKIN